VAGNTDAEPPRYILYLDTDRDLPPDAQAVMDRCLCENSVGYTEVRTMHELACAEVFRVRQDTFSEYQYFCQAKGARMEQAKPIRVLTREDQIAFFNAARENG
jgi:hypothetical protein